MQTCGGLFERYLALHLLLAALGPGPGDEVIIPAFTMIAVANAVCYTGASCKLVDSELRYLNLIPGQEIESARTSRFSCSRNSNAKSAVICSAVAKIDNSRLNAEVFLKQ